VRFPDALAELNTRQPEHMPKPDLSRIRGVAELLDDPQLRFPTIHVTGTNGKTTTARLAAALACEHGLPTGLFTSPHLLSVTERLSVCDELISEVEFGEEYEHLLPFLQAVDARSSTVTYFEALTALAYLWFADRPVALGVFEVGMGGTWDATNLVEGDVAVLCPVGLDHPELGSTVEEVAVEKAGIIKSGKIAVVREQPAGALRVIEARCHEVGATMLLEGRDFALESRAVAVGGQSVTVRGLHGSYESVLLSLFGGFAGHSAAAAIVALEAFVGQPLDEEAVRRVFERATSPGRLEVVRRHPLVVLDGAHNPGAAEALAASLAEAFVWARLHLVTGVFTNKDLDGIAERLGPLADRVYACAVGSIRARTPEEVGAAFTSRGVATQAFTSVSEALAEARAAAAKEDLILVTGSLYTVADARRALLEETGRTQRGDRPPEEEP
jgi:dihydrofolate synthase/folylpolyglutamate synthase